MQKSTHQHLSYLRNKQGFTLLEILVTLVIFTMTLVIGYKIILTVMTTLDTNIELAKQVTQIEEFNKLLLQDLHHAENLFFIDDKGVLTLSYTSKNTPKEVTFTPSNNGLYTLDYTQNDRVIKNWLVIEQVDADLPINYVPSANQLLFKFKISDIPFKFTLYVRRGYNE